MERYTVLKTAAAHVELPASLMSQEMSSEEAERAAD
jgi:hypothetical protein